MDLNKILGLVLDVGALPHPIYRQAVNSIHIKDVKSTWTQRLEGALKGIMQPLDGEKVVQTVKEAGHEVKLLRKRQSTHILNSEIHRHTSILSAFPCQRDHLGRSVHTRDSNSLFRHPHGKAALAAGNIQ